MGSSAADSAERFREKYARGLGHASHGVVREACGSVLVNGYTTAEQAERLAWMLNVSRGSRFLDLGAGLGWPGLRIAEITGAHVVASDIPIDALAGAMAWWKDTDDRPPATFVAADGQSLPFVPGVFDAVVHADVFC